MVDVESALLRADGVTGKCYVMTFSAKHHLTLADMSPREVVPLVDAWTALYRGHLGTLNHLGVTNDDGLVPKTQLRYMQIFENKGAAMGCSNPHPHCQVWTTSHMPEEPGAELFQMGKYRAEHGGRHLLEDYVKLELSKGERLVWKNDGFAVVCPWWAVWPFEVLIIPKTHLRALTDMTVEQKVQFAEAIVEVTRRYDNLFECRFPYSTYHCTFKAKLTRQALEYTRLPWTAQRRRWTTRTSTCTSILPCSGRPR